MYSVVYIHTNKIPCATPSVCSINLSICPSRLDEDGKVLTPEELLYRVSPKYSQMILILSLKENSLHKYVFYHSVPSGSAVCQYEP